MDLRDTIRRAAALLGLLALAAHLALGLRETIPSIWRRVRHDLAHWGEPLPTARARVFPAYGASLANPLAWIRPGEPYWLADEDQSGAALLLQGDLAPRLALPFPGRVPATGEPPLWTVVFRGRSRPVEILSSEEYLTRRAAQARALREAGAEPPS